MSADIPSLPPYEKPVERKQATLPTGIPVPPKVPSSLNKMVGKMLKPSNMRMMKSFNSAKSLKNKHKVNFY